MVFAQVRSQDQRMGFAMSDDFCAGKTKTEVSLQHTGMLLVYEQNQNV